MAYLISPLSALLGKQDAGLVRLDATIYAVLENVIKVRMLLGVPIRRSVRALAYLPGSFCLSFGCCLGGPP